MSPAQPIFKFCNDYTKFSIIFKDSAKIVLLSHSTNIEHINEHAFILVTHRSNRIRTSSYNICVVKKLKYHPTKMAGVPSTLIIISNDPVNLPSAAIFVIAKNLFR